MQKTQFKLNDYVLLDRDDDLEEALPLNTDWNITYKIIKVIPQEDITYYNLASTAKNEVVLLKEHLPYSFIDGELLSMHTEESITHYLENLVLQRFTLKQLQNKINTDFQQELSITRNDYQVLESDDDSFIFTLSFERMIVDVTLYCLDTNVQDVFIITEVVYSFERDLKLCLYCYDDNLGIHYRCHICQAGMCKVCYSTLVELDIHYVNILENCDSQREIDLIIKACNGISPAYLCEICTENILK